MNKNRNEFKIIFEGDVEELDTDILIANLFNTTTMLQEVNKELKSQYKLEIKIKPFAIGSFNITYSIIAAGLLDAFVKAISSGASEYLKRLITIVIDQFNLKKFLGGKKPVAYTEKGNITQVENNYGNIINVDKISFNIYKDNLITNDAMIRQCRALKKGGYIDKFSIKDEEGKLLLEIDKKEFDLMCEQNELIEEGERQKIVEDAKLVIFKIVWESGYKWGFIYDGVKISAHITDEDSFNKIKSNGFYEGDYFIARLKIIQRYDERVKTFINIDYEIEEIKEHIKTPKQKPLDFSEK